MLVATLVQAAVNPRDVPPRGHTYHSITRCLFDDPTFANRRYRARLTHNHRRSQRQMRVHTRLDRLECKFCNIVNILQRLYKLDKWSMLDKITDALLRDTHCLFWELLYDKDTCHWAAANSKPKKRDHSRLT